MSQLSIFRVDKQKQRASTCYSCGDSKLGCVEIPWTWGSIRVNMCPKRVLCNIACRLTSAQTTWDNDPPHD